MSRHPTSIRHPGVIAPRGICPLFALVLGGATCLMAQTAPVEFAIPGDIGWRAAQQPPFSPDDYFPDIDYARAPGGVAPLDTALVVGVPDLPEVAVLDELDQQQRESIDKFASHVARDDLHARRDVVVDADTLVRAGQVMIAAGESLPRRVADIRLLTRAGIDRVRAMVNLAHAVLWPRNPQFRFESLLWSPTLYESQLNDNMLRTNLEHLIDADASTAFVRADGPNRAVEKRSVVIRMDLVSRFPVGMVRFYPRAQATPLAINGYSLEVNDGIDLKPASTGEPARVTTGTYELLGDQALESGGVPIYELLATAQGSRADTVKVALDPPRYLRFLQFRSLTALDFDLAELEVFGRGFPPSATYVTRPLPFDRDALAVVLDYQAGNLDRRVELDTLSGATLGRVFWDERSIGDPARSSAVVSMRTGTSPEPMVLFRLNRNGDAVEWRRDAHVVDHRPDSRTQNQAVWLDDPLLRAGARAVWDALPAAQRADAQTTFSEYARLPVAARQDRHGLNLPRVADAVSWGGGFQPLENGHAIAAPGERRFFQLRIDFDSRDPSAATIVENLRFELSLPPAVAAVRAEVVPAADIDPAVDTLFTYALSLQAGPETAGVNRIRVFTPVTSDVLGVESVAPADGSGGGASVMDLRFDNVVTTSRFFVVALPGLPDIRRASGGDTRLLINFRTRVLDTKTTFDGQVFLDTLAPALTRSYGDIITVGATAAGEADAQVLRILPQGARAGDVVDFGASRRDRNSLSATRSAAAPVGDVVARVTVRPNPFTPNGDGINDRAHIGYDLLRVMSEVEVEAGIHDLSGRCLRSWRRRVAPGEAADLWDGTDSHGDLVPPGLYLLRLRVRADAGAFGVVHRVSVVY